MSPLVTAAPASASVMSPLSIPSASALTCVSLIMPDSRAASRVATSPSVSASSIAVALGLLSPTVYRHSPSLVSDSVSSGSPERCREPVMWLSIPATQGSRERSRSPAHRASHQSPSRYCPEN